MSRSSIYYSVPHTSGVSKLQILIALTERFKSLLNNEKSGKGKYTNL